MAGSRRFTRKEILLMLDKASPREKVFVLLGIYTGTRTSEALALKIGDIRGKDYLTIKALKKGDVQQYPIPPRLKQGVKDLCAWYEENGVKITNESPLFISLHFLHEGTPLSKRGLYRMFHEFVKGIGIKGKVSPHGLRKSFITSIYRITGKDIVKTRVYSRHKSLTNLQYYIDSGTDTELVKALKWDESDQIIEEKEGACISM